MRTAATIGLLALLGAHAAELAHGLTAEHARCPEHGDLIHAGGDPARPRAQTGVAARKNEPPARHDHCRVEWLARFQAALTDAPAIVPVDPPAAPAPTIARDAPASSPLAFAPKTSPPTT